MIGNDVGVKFNKVSTKVNRRPTVVRKSRILEDFCQRFVSSRPRLESAVKSQEKVVCADEPDQRDSAIDQNFRINGSSHCDLYSVTVKRDGRCAVLGTVSRRHHEFPFLFARMLLNRSFN